MSYKKKMKKRKIKIVFGSMLAIILILTAALIVLEIRNKNAAVVETQKKTEPTAAGDEKDKGGEEPEEEKGPEIVSLTVSAAGDCTLGTDEGFVYSTGFVAKYKEVNDPGYFFEKVKPIFADDDLTIVNMEGTLTEETARQPKQFAFKADPEYAKILTEGSVEAANIANNHSRDYGEKSYTDTIAALDAEGIPSFGYERTALLDVKGIKVGLVGTYELADHMGCEAQMIENIDSLKEQGAQIIIVSFHWGIERENVPNNTQVTLAHSAVDHGADLVLGHHPHVLQGIEEYKGKNIVYSMGNFCFGGNSGPRDMDAMIFQQTFTFEDGKLQEDNVKNIIPCKISSSYESGRNNYQPMPAEGDVKDAIMERIEKYSRAVQPSLEGSAE